MKHEINTIKVNSFFDALFQNYTKLKFRKYLYYKTAFENRIKNNIRRIPRLANSNECDFFYNSFLMTTCHQIQKEQNTFIIPALPHHTYEYRNYLLKIPNLNQDSAYYLHRWTSFLMYALFAGQLLAYSIYNFTYTFAHFTNLSYIILLSTSFTLNLLCFFDSTAFSASVPSSYMIFDPQLRAVIIKGRTPEYIVPYNTISFNLRIIEDSPAYCAVEMQIDEPGQIPKKLIMDICESQPQALSIIKTYYEIISGRETLFNTKLKRHPALLSEFNMPWWKGMMHFFRITLDWYSFVFVYYNAFRWAHGHPMGVLKQYVMKKELNVLK